MALFNRFPFSNAHELNLDWILRQLKDLLRRVKHLEESGGGGGGTSDYDALSNKPQINSVILSGNKTAAQLGLGTYSKPASGIPATDLAPGVIPTVPEAATATPLMDGTAAVGSSIKYAREDHKHPSDTQKANKWNVSTIATSGDATQSMVPNTFYVFTSSALTSLKLQVLEFSNSNQYHVRFKTGTTPPTLTITGAILPDGFTLEAQKIYELDILDKYVAVTSWTGV